MTGGEPFRAFNCSILSTSDGATAVTISEEPGDNIETGIELILKYVVVMFKKQYITVYTILFLLQMVHPLLLSAKNQETTLKRV